MQTENKLCHNSFLDGKINPPKNYIVLGDTIDKKNLLFMVLENQKCQ